LDIYDIRGQDIETDRQTDRQTDRIQAASVPEPNVLIPAVPLHHYPIRIRIESSQKRRSKVIC
jgi:hypothetical protein